MKSASLQISDICGVLKSYKSPLGKEAAHASYRRVAPVGVLAYRGGASRKRLLSVISQGEPQPVVPGVSGRGWPQEEIIALRTVRDLTMPSKRRIVDDALYAHFVTFSVFRRRRVLDHDHPQRIVLGVLNSLLIEGDVRCIEVNEGVRTLHFVGSVGMIPELSRIAADPQATSRDLENSDA
jgi:hypothetical protein